jgi:hypothetical protein
VAAIRHRTGFLRRLLLQGALVELPGVLGVLAGVGRPVGVAQPLLQRGRLLVELDRPDVRGQLPPLGDLGRSRALAACWGVRLAVAVVCWLSLRPRMAFFRDLLAQLTNGRDRPASASSGMAVSTAMGRRLVRCLGPA